MVGLIYYYYIDAVGYEDEVIAFTEKLWWTALPMGLQLPAA
jgi:hypothetical protein